MGDFNWRDELIAASRNVGQKPASRLTIAQRSSQGGDMNSEGGFVDKRVGPNPSQELVFRDELARTLDKGFEDGERSAPEADGSLAFQQKLLRRKESKWAE